MHVIWMLAAAAAAPPVAPAPDDIAKEIVVRPGEAVAATVDGHPARLRVATGRVDRLTLDVDYVTMLGLKPALVMGRADLSVAGRREFKGRNRSVTLTLAGTAKKDRAFWFEGAPDSGDDGRVGPWGMPQQRVTITLGPADPADTLSRAPLYGSIDTASFTGIKVGDGQMSVAFDVDDPEPYPVASAAAGALIAGTYGGQLSGASWDVEVMFGVKRPVRLLTLARPMSVGPFSFTQIAVRVRDRIDASGRGREIADADAPGDPAEVVVEGVAKKGPRPLYTLSIPRTALKTCSRLTFDKAARVIELMCRPVG